MYYEFPVLSSRDCLMTEFLKFVGPRGQKIMRSANNVGNAGPHVRQTFMSDVFTFLTEVGNAGHIVNTGISSVNSEFVIFYLFLVNIIGNCHENKYIVMRKMIFSSEKHPKN